MHEYRLAEDSPEAGPAATDVVRATAAASESDPAAAATQSTAPGVVAAGGTAIGRTGSRTHEATHPDTGAGGDVVGGFGRSSSSSPKANSPKTEPGSDRRIGTTSWVVVRVLKRSSLTAEEEAMVAKQPVVAQPMVSRNEMVEQQMMVMQQLCGAPSPKGKPETDEEAPVAGYHAGLSVHGVHFRGDSPSLDSPRNNSPTTLSRSLSPNSSCWTMPVDVRSSVVANREAAVGATIPVGPEEEDASIVAKVAITGAAEGEAVEAVPMEVQGTGAGVGADKLSSSSANKQQKSSRQAGGFLKGPLCPENLPSFKHYLFELKPPGSGRSDGGVEGGDGMGEQQQTEEEQQMQKEQKKRELAKKLDWRVELDSREEDGQKVQGKGDQEQGSWHVEHNQTTRKKKPKWQKLTSRQEQQITTPQHQRDLQQEGPTGAASPAAADNTAAAAAAGTAGAAGSGEGGDRSADPDIRVEDLQELADILNSLLRTQVTSTTPATRTSPRAASSAAAATAPTVPPPAADAFTATATVAHLVASEPQPLGGSGPGVVPTGVAPSATPEVASAARRVEPGGFQNSTAASYLRIARAHSFDAPLHAAASPSVVPSVPPSTASPRGKRHKGQQGGKPVDQDQQRQQQEEEKKKRQQQQQHAELHQYQTLQQQRLSPDQQKQQQPVAEEDSKCKQDHVDEPRDDFPWLRAQEYMHQHQGLSPHLPWQRSVSCPAVSLPLQALSQGANQYETPFRTSHSLEYHQSQSMHEELEGQGRLYGRYFSDLLHTSLWEIRETEVAGEGMEGERMGQWGGLGGMIRSSSWGAGAHGLGMDHGEESSTAGVRVGAAGVAAAGVAAVGVEAAGVVATGVAAAGSGMAVTAEGDAAAGIEPNGAVVETVGLGVAAMRVREGGGVEGGEGGDDMMTSVHGMELEELEALLLDVDEDDNMEISSSMVSGFSHHSSTSTDCRAALPVDSGVPPSVGQNSSNDIHSTTNLMRAGDTTAGEQMGLFTGPAPSVALGPSLGQRFYVFTPMYNGSGVSFASEEGTAAAMAAYPTINTTGGSDGMWSKGHETLLLPEPFFPARVVVGTGGRAQTGGAAEESGGLAAAAGAAAAGAAAAVAAAEAAAAPAKAAAPAAESGESAAREDAEVVTAGRIVSVSRETPMGTRGLGSSQGLGRMLSPKRSCEEDY
ncbi:unnamed protein product [Closterium sp. NIES-53]